VRICVATQMRSCMDDSLPISGLDNDSSLKRTGERLTTGRSMTRTHPHRRGRVPSLREDSMERQSRHHHGRRAVNSLFKSVAPDPLPPKYGRDARDARVDSQYDRDDRTSRSNTPLSCPAMTHCSSTSASSSITECDHVADAGQCHTCQNLSDVESYANQNSDGEYVLQFLQILKTCLAVV
jgi:hypothetical protein